MNAMLATGRHLALFSLLCLLAACGEDKKLVGSKIPDTGEGGTSNLDGMGGFISGDGGFIYDPGSTGGSGGEGGAGGAGGIGGEGGLGEGGAGGIGGDGGEGGSGGEGPTPCETMCGHVLDFCGLQEPTFEPDCVAHCEAELSEGEIDCLSTIVCLPEEIDRCLDRMPPHRCEELCPTVYDQCGKHMVQSNKAPIEQSLCGTVCPLLDNEYLDCLENATTCDDIDLCNGVVPPGPCEELCDKVYDECRNGFPIGTTPKISKAQCISNCENGVYTEEQRSCVRDRSCEHTSQCFYPDASEHCSAACYWMHTQCNEWYGPVEGLFSTCTAFRQEAACLDLCTNGANACNGNRYFAPWPETLRTCSVNVGLNSCNPCKGSTCGTSGFIDCFIPYGF